MTFKHQFQNYVIAKLFTLNFTFRHLLSNVIIFHSNHSFGLRTELKFINDFQNLLSSLA